MKGASIGGRVASIAWMLACACSPEPLQLDVPFEPQDRAALIVIEKGARIEVVALEEDSRDTQALLRSISDVTDADPLVVTVLYYTTGLAGLRLSPGPIQPARDGGAPLPPPVRTLRAVLGGNGAASWSPPRELGPGIDTFRVDFDTPCLPLSPQRRYEFEPGAWLAGLLSSTDDEALLVLGVESTGGVVHALGLEGAPQVPVRLPPVRILEAAGTAQRMWIAGGEFSEGAQLWVGSKEGEFTQVATRDVFSSDWPEWMVVAAEPQEVVYTLSPKGTLSRYSADEGWNTIREGQPGMYGSNGDMAWVAPGQLYFVEPDGRSIYRFADGVARREPTDSDMDFFDDEDYMVSVASIPGVGDFAGTNAGILLMRMNGRWRRAGEPVLINSTLNRFVPFGEGMLIGGWYGLVQQYYPGDGLCADDLVFTGQNETVFQMMPLARGVVVAGLRRNAAGGRTPFAATLTTP